MSLLKIREPDGTVHSIATFKGNKGDGVPDGGEAGQVLKKTEDGTEWGEVSAPPHIVLSNTENDTTITSVGITQRGLYEVRVRIFYLKNSSTGYGTYSNFFRGVVSISDLDASFDQNVYGELNSDNSFCRCYLRYADGAISATYGKNNGNSTSNSEVAYLSEVRLILPYD
jgi:hypothetical protein